MRIRTAVAKFDVWNSKPCDAKSRVRYGVDVASPLVWFKFPIIGGQNSFLVFWSLFFFFYLVFALTALVVALSLGDNRRGDRRIVRQRLLLLVGWRRLQRSLRRQPLFCICPCSHVVRDYSQTCKKLTIKAIFRAGERICSSSLYCARRMSGTDKSAAIFDWTLKKQPKRILLSK